MRSADKHPLSALEDVVVAFNGIGVDLIGAYVFRTTVGAKAQAWIKNVTPKITKTGGKIAADAGTKILQKMIESCLGLS